VNTVSVGSDIDLRPAEPGDAEAAVPLFYSSGPSGFDFMFGVSSEEVLRFLRYAFARGAGFLGYRVFTAAVLNGAVVAVGAFYGGGDVPRLSFQALGAIFRYFGLWRGLGVLVRIARLSRLTPAPPRDALFVSGVGVARSSQGRGIGSALLAHELKKGRERGLRRAVLDVTSDNPRAERLYARLGMEVVAERVPSAALADRLPSLRRMQITL
jgi:ribosomal protein S18 acetylase RimI-like enzyme